MAKGESPDGSALKDIMLAAADEAWGYLSEWEEADAERPNMPYKWRRDTNTKVEITFGSHSYNSTQSFRRLEISGENASLLVCKVRGGDAEVLEREVIYLGNPSVFDKVKEFVDGYRARVMSTRPRT